MTYSLNELESLIRKAVTGAGFPPGHAAAIAAAGKWLARRRAPVCEIVERAIADGISQSKFERTQNRITFRNARAASDGLAAIDVILASPPATTAVLTDLDEPMMLLGLMGAMADAHAAAFRLISQARTVTISPGSDTITANDYNNLANSSVELIRAHAPPPVVRPPPVLATRYDPVLAADTGWNRLTELAARTYVRASESSRLKGAGAGLIDND